MATKVEDALALADETLELLESGDGRLTPLVLRCLRIARLLGWTEAEQWFLYELQGYSGEAMPDGSAMHASWSGRKAGSLQKDGVQQYYTAPIEVIEMELDIARNELSTVQEPSAPVPEPTKVPSYYSASTTPTERLVASARNIRNEANVKIRRWTKVVATLRGNMHEWLVRATIPLKYSNILNTVFSRTKARFDKLLSIHAPGAAKALAAAFERADAGGSESKSQALTSCRRALKALADVLYPATKDRPTGRDLGDNSYKNRLIQFAAEQLDSKTQKDLVSAEIGSVARRADALNELASKGVHSEADTRDLELTVVHTYLLAGDLLSLLPEESEKTVSSQGQSINPDSEGYDASESARVQDTVEAGESESGSRNGS